MWKPYEMATLLSLALLCLVRSGCNGSIMIDQVAFSKDFQSSNGGTLFGFVRNTGSSSETVSSATVNGASVPVGVNGWSRFWPKTIAPGGVSTVSICGISSPYTEGTSVTLVVNTAGGSSASRTQTLSTPALRIGNVIASQDRRTIYIYLRNTDPGASYTVTQVFLNTDITSQATFVGGSTIAAGGLGIIKVPFASPQPPMAPYAVRVYANKSTGGSIALGSPVRLVDPWWTLGTWSSAAPDYANTPGTSHQGIQGAHQLQLDVAVNYNNWPSINSMFAQYALGTLNDVRLPDDPRMPDLNEVLPNINNTAVKAWFVKDEPDLSPSTETPTKMLQTSMVYWDNDPNHPSWMNMAQSTSYFSRYAHICDIFSEDNYTMSGITATETLKKNCEPTRVWVWSTFDNSTFSWRRYDFEVNRQFWGQVMYGAKGVTWFKYGAGPTDNWAATYPVAWNEANVVTRQFSQIRNLCLYSDVSDCVSISSNPANKARARALIGENQMVVVLLNDNYTILSMSNTTGTFSLPIPSWIPVEQVVQVTDAGTTPVAYTVSSGVLSLNFGTLGKRMQTYVIGKLDTEAPSKPTRLNLSEVKSDTDYILSWKEPFDNWGVKGYKVYANGTEVGDTRYPLYEVQNLASQADAEFTVKAYDAAGNLSAQSSSVKYCRWQFNEDGYSDAWIPLNQMTNVGVANGLMSFDISGGDPYMQGPITRIDTAQRKYVRIKMRNGTSGTTAELFWLRSDDLAWGGAKYVSFPVSANTPDVRQYTVNLSSNSAWTGTIPQLRVDPVAGPSSGHIYIDQIDVLTDGAGPTGTITINAGATYATSSSAILSLSATDNSGTVSTMRFSNDGVNWSAWEPYAASKTWTLSGGDGAKTLRVQYADPSENWSPSYADTITLDTQPPTTPAAPTDTGVYAAPGSVTFNWTAASDSGSGVSGYNCRIGTTPGGSDVFDGRVSKVYAKSATGTANHAYYCQIQAKDNAGLLGSWSGSSDGIFVVSHPGVSISEAKALPDGEGVGIAAGEVTLFRDSAIWIEASDRTGGVRVVPRAALASPTPGDIVQVGGVMATSPNHERYVDALVALTEHQPTVRPLGMSVQSVGGADWRYISQTGAGQVGLDAGAGLNTVGLLIRTWGSITRLDSSSFSVSDGTGPVLKCFLPVGVTLDPSWTYVCVTGVCSLLNDGGTLKPCILVRSAEDLIGF